MYMKKVYEIGTVFLCKVLKISKTYFTVRTSTQERGIVFINDISDYFVKDLEQIVGVGDVLYLTLKEVKGDGNFVFSFKTNKASYLRTPFEWDLSKSSNKDEFQNLFDFVNKEIKKWRK